MDQVMFNMEFLNSFKGALEYKDMLVMGFKICQISNFDMKYGLDTFKLTCESLNIFFGYKVTKTQN